MLKIGNSVTTVKPVDHVIMGFASCGHCRPCLSGKNGACDNFNELNFMGKNRYGHYVMKSEQNEDISQFLVNHLLHTIVSYMKPTLLKLTLK